MKESLNTKVKNLLIHYYMHHGDLREDVDYKSVDERLEHYTNLVNDLDESALVESLTDLQLENM